MRISERKRITIASSTGVVRGERISYRLIRETGMRPIYGIRINIGKDEIERAISSDIKEAAVFYDRIVRNLVTPNTLDDIIEDFFGKYCAK